MEPRISIIVPVFNTRAYLVQALNSLIAAPASRIEVIVVHDGGNDGSLALAQDWAKQAPVSARVIDQPNSGLSAARMAGLAHASGRFVSFLDSDDLADAAVLLAMTDLAEETGCDLVLCRSVVFDSATLATQPFYDAPIWELIMQGQRFRRTTLEQEPRLLRLEPNTNPRVFRRGFIDRIGLDFPLGLMFEDMAPHVRGLAAAGAVGLLDETGYWYRVGRPGKITDQRSAGRFDALKSVALAIGAAQGLGEDARANLALQAVRLLYWCAQNVTNADRPRFIAEALAIVGRFGRPVLRRARLAFSIDERERLLLGAFAAGAEQVLCDLASHRRPAVLPALALALHPEGRTAAKLGLRHASLPPMRALNRVGRRLARGLAA